MAKIVEDLIYIDVSAFGKIKPGGFGSGAALLGGGRLQVNLTVSLGHGVGTVQLDYELPGPPGSPSKKVSLPVRRVGRPAPHGNAWSFICPRSAAGRACGHPAKRLYLADDEIFGCRFCQNVIYESQTRMRKGADRLFRNPVALRNRMSSPLRLEDKRDVVQAYFKMKKKLLRELRKKQRGRRPPRRPPPSRPEAGCPPS